MKKITVLVFIAIVGFMSSSSYAAWYYDESRILNYEDGEYNIFPSHIEKIDKDKLTGLREVNGPVSGYMDLEYPISMRGLTATKLQHTNCGQAFFFRDKNDGFVSVFTILPNIYSSNKGYIGYNGTTLVMYFKNVQAYKNNTFGRYDIQLEFYKNGTVKIAYIGGKNWEQYSELYKHLVNWKTAYTSFSIENYLYNCKNISHPFEDGSNGFIISSNSSKVTLDFNQLAITEESNLFYQYFTNAGEEINGRIKAANVSYEFENVNTSRGITFFPMENDKNEYSYHWLIDGQEFTSSLVDERQDANSFTLNLIKNTNPKYAIFIEENNEGTVSSFPLNIDSLSDIDSATTSTVTIVAEPSEGYDFGRWVGNIPEEDKESKILSLDVNSDYNLKPYYRKKQHTVEVEIANNKEYGTIAQEEFVVNRGGNIIAKVTPVNSQWRVKSWSINGMEIMDTPTNEFTLGDVKQDYVLTVKLVSNTVFVNIFDYKKAEGTVSPVEGEYNYGDIITITAAPNAGYEFVKWEGVQENNTANPLIITLASDINIKPVFEKKSYAVTLNVGSFGSVQVDNDVIYGPGLYELPYSAFDTPVFIAIPNKGYLMNRWTGGVPSGQENNKTLIFDELTASNALNISFNQKIDNNGEWTVDSSSDGEVIVDPVTGITELRGDGFDSAYTLTPENVPVLNKSLVEFRVKFDGQYQIYFHCTTNMGEKSISYSGDSEGYYVEDSDYGIVYGLGGETMNNEWMVQNRDLNADLQTALGYPELRVESIDKIIVRGNGFIDYFKFLCGDTDTDKDGLSDIFEKNVSLTDMNEQDSDNDGIFDADEDFDNDGISNMEEFERGTDPYNVKPNIGETENTYFWEIYGGKEFSSVEVVVDSADSDNEVVKLSGQGFASSYVFYPESDISGMTKAEWKMRFNESYKIHFHCMTSEGWRYISYTADEVSAPAGDGIEIVTGLGKSTKSGHWVTVRRDLQADLSAAQPGNKILYIDFFNVRGSGLIDDICFFDSNIWEDSDNDGLPDDYETTILLTDPLRKDSNLDGVFDGDEDFDNDGISNYQEFLDATDPYDIKANIGETEEIKHWEIYGGEEFSSVETVIDPTNFENEVVKLSGQGFASSYVFYPESDISGMTKAEWKMRFNESNKIHFHCMTSEGWRYISYTADEVSAPAGDGIEIVTGLGKNAKNGHWLTVRRDLQADLSAAQPGNKILYIDFFNVRGSGLIDDICFF